MTLWGKRERVHMQNVSSCMHMFETVAYVDEAYWSSTPCARQDMNTEADEALSPL